MGDGQAGLVDPLLAVDEEVEIERPRASGRPFPGAPVLPLDAQEDVEQLARAERGFHSDGPVQEARLVGDQTDGIGLAKSRYGHDLDARGRVEARDRAAERGLTVAEVRADTDVRPGYDRILPSRRS